jgi:hypothetical protein
MSHLFLDRRNDAQAQTNRRVLFQVPGTLAVRHEHSKGHSLRPARQAAELESTPLPRIAIVEEAAERQGKRVEARFVPQSRERLLELETHVCLVDASDQMLDKRAD